MARGINKVILIGNLGADPDTRMTQQGSAVTNLNIATDESYKDKNTGQMVPKTEWHRIVMFNRLAEIAKDYLKKGSKVYIEGRLQTDKYQKDGVDHYQTKIIANELQMLDSKPGSGSYDQGENNSGYSQQYNAPVYEQAPQPQQAYQQNHNAPQQPKNMQAPPQTARGQQYAPQQTAPQPQRNMAPVTDDFDDDIPF
jgi:single-strand DNA-binding protein